MKQIFPPDITEYSFESHFHRHKRQFYWVYILVILLVSGTICTLPFITMEITTQSRGSVKTAYENNLIQSSNAGRIEYLNITEGENVHKGDTLLVLCTDLIQEHIQLLDNTIAENNLFIHDLRRLIKGHTDVSTTKYRQESIQNQAEVENFNIDIALLKKEYQLAQELYSDNVTPEFELLQKKNRYDAAVSKLDVYKKQAYTAWQQELVKLEQANRRHMSDILKSRKEKELYVLRAPVNGTLTQMAGIYTGSYITPGQALAQISPDKELIAECYIQPKDIGFIKKEQKVRLQFDAFNYHQWGMIETQVACISNDIILVNQQPVFRVRCKLPIDYLQLKSGHKGMVKRGMTLTGRFVLTERTLYQLLFDKVDDWLNPKLRKSD
ncbi:HlyD family secretion protein [Carboxylicivirga marina]|uniref:HlyD family secretion protein n=1 Tax=Carboxylicivirga marina TaxID=2800988 RepID=UPI002598EAED|nr:HlyD family efflux transporter periplasmic adaptor subunit [uncultured Carboxylicivirga sp.]